MTTTADHTAAGFGRFSRGDLVVVSILSIIAVCAGFAILAPKAPAMEMIDHTLFTQTVDRMRGGAGYYEAMDATLAELYGPERADVTETVIGFRPPTTFLVWRLLPSDWAIWLLFVAVSGVAGLLSIRVVRFPPISILVTAYLLSIGMLRTGDVWIGQFTTTELWAVPVMIGAMVAVLKERWWLAAGLAVAAFAVRETAAPLILLGAGLSLFRIVPRLPWLSALAAATGLYGVHAILALEYIDPAAETPLVSRAEGLLSFFRILEFGLPGGYVVGPILWALALYEVLRRGRKGLLLTAYLWLPLVGFVVERRYWGVMTVPFMILWGLDRVAAVAARGNPADELLPREGSPA